MTHLQFDAKEKSLFYNFVKLQNGLFCYAEPLNQ